MLALERQRRFIQEADTTHKTQRASLTSSLLVNTSSYEIRSVCTEMAHPNAFICSNVQVFVKLYSTRLAS